MLPEEGGYYRWVDRAFGRFWAFQNGWLTWMYSLVDMAIYPMLFNQYLTYFVPGLDARFEWAVALVVIWGATAHQSARRGARGTRARYSPARSSSPGSSPSRSPRCRTRRTSPGARSPRRKARGREWTRRRASRSRSGTTSGGTTHRPSKGEVKDASRSYPRALAFALPLVVVGYLVPLLTDARPRPTGRRGRTAVGRQIAAAAARGRVGRVPRRVGRSRRNGERARACSTRCCCRTRAFRS